MTSIPAEVTPIETEPAEKGARRREELVSDVFVKEAERFGLKSSDAIALGEILLDSIILSLEVAPLFKGGRALCADLLEQGLRSTPAGELEHPKGRSVNVDAAIEQMIESQFPAPTQVVRNEVAINDCVVWFDEQQDAFCVEALSSSPQFARSAAGACALCDSSERADAQFSAVSALRETPTRVERIPDDSSDSTLELSKLSHAR